VKKIFISRNLNKKSPFVKALQEEKVEIIGKGLIRFSAINFNTVPDHDWLFFYSKNGFKYFEKALKKANIQRPSSSKWASFGISTAQLLPEIDFVGSGDPQRTANAFLKKAENQKVLFIQARNSQRSIQKILDSKIQAMELAVYKNTPKKKFDIPSCEILCFTSPLNAKAYFSKYALQKKQKVISIGKTTANALTELGIKKVVLADNPSEIGLAEKVIELM